MAAQRGLSEYEYCARTSWRIFRLHCSAYLKDRFAVAAAAMEAFGLVGDAVQSADETPAPARPAAPARQVQRTDHPTLPAHFRRKPGFKYSAHHLDGPMRGLRGAVKQWAGS